LATLKKERDNWRETVLAALNRERDNRIIMI
jgi:hypothetical protein